MSANWAGGKPRDVIGGKKTAAVAQVDLRDQRVGVPEHSGGSAGDVDGAPGVVSRPAQTTQRGSGEGWSSGPNASSRPRGRNGCCRNANGWTSISWVTRFAPGQLDFKIRKQLALGSERKVYISADARADHGLVREVLGAVRLSGAERVAFLVDKRDRPYPTP